jgi:hypothetical protein
MTRVCLLGDGDVNLRYELLSRETARDALLTYDLREPYENAIGVETVSLGAAVALLNDLDWYLIRFVDATLVKEPSVSETEWLSRDLAAAIRDNEVDPDETGRFLKVYGVERPAGDDAENGATTDGSDDREPSEPTQSEPPRLVEPMLVARTGKAIPDYDLRDVEETLTVRVTEAEFDA